MAVSVSQGDQQASWAGNEYVGRREEAGGLSDPSGGPG